MGQNRRYRNETKERFQSHKFSNRKKKNRKKGKQRLQHNAQKRGSVKLRRPPPTPLLANTKSWWLIRLKMQNGHDKKKKDACTWYKYFGAWETLH